METLSYKTISANKATVNKEWVVVDATGHSLGRLCSEIAKILRGKNKPNFTPHVDCGDNVIVINADKVVLTGLKWTDREYLTFSGYPGGQKAFSPERLKQKGVDRLFRKVVKGMLPKNKLGDKIINNLYVYGGSEHKHAAQQPKLVELKTI
ncbi:50S ribosomal protein L13 [Porphyromonas cangingivalis]|uniref:Large ribosomal subunit protein uL13 n=1 Tax=Porphyromonas cangingivalis TaxID=36874 RepID=A0A099WX56_PORCN|nr:50S ribosomal protein L13 [Porphyromonas cangingivalis]KGL49246.1 50S ribosomal protein L13 [Porphyromonas cangingivalis]KGN81267.1 50S ribosomal protein L13 [Porphyromonas cangingivalis]SJZ62426.1 large subunit ribosomal protein L13 [Porphyromonas cangingivalis]SPY34856.1 50S ribosomal protein L13 [Porphyromonas cangingivalis]VEJ02304.1 50S ribosomal protein L13 [Porphyromonas cangingivalis]